MIMSMKGKQKNLVIAIVISLIITTIITGLIYLNTRQTDTSDSGFLMSGIVEETLGGPYVPWWLLSVIAMVCFVVLTLVFYFVIGFLQKRKK